MQGEPELEFLPTEESDWITSSVRYRRAGVDDPGACRVGALHGGRDIEDRDSAVGVQAPPSCLLALTVIRFREEILINCFEPSDLIGDVDDLHSLSASNERNITDGEA